jgi:type I restriction enzyme R subunit
LDLDHTNGWSSAISQVALMKIIQFMAQMEHLTWTEVRAQMAFSKKRDGFEAIRQLTLPDPGLTGADGRPMTVGEALDTIEANIRRRLESSGSHPVYVALSERLERLRHRQLSQASASVEFLREILDLAQQVTAVERADDSGDLNSVSILPDPNVGALTQIFREYAPPGVPVIIENVVTDIDTIVRQVRFTGWTQTQNGDRTVRREVRLTLKKYGLPSAGELFDRAYAYIRENY